MPRFFVDPTQIENGFIKITGDDAHHISRSLRMAVGDSVTLCDMQGVDYECTLDAFTDSYVLAKIISSNEVSTEPPFKAHLFQALPKGDKLDYIIQKAVECGVHEITTFQSERCIAKEKANDENKLKRRNRISLEAAKQSGRGLVPKVNSTISFDAMLKSIKDFDIALFCYEKSTSLPLKALLCDCMKKGGKKQDLNIAVIIGSEGGFSEKEAAKAEECGAYMAGLGKRILRTETASGFVLSSLVYEFEL